MWFDSWRDLMRVVLVGIAACALIVLVLRGSGKRTWHSSTRSTSSSPSPSGPCSPRSFSAPTSRGPRGPRPRRPAPRRGLRLWTSNSGSLIQCRRRGTVLTAEGVEFESTKRWSNAQRSSRPSPVPPLICWFSPLLRCKGTAQARRQDTPLLAGQPWHAQPQPTQVPPSVGDRHEPGGPDLRHVPNSHGTVGERSSSVLLPDLVRGEPVQGQVRQAGALPGGSSMPSPKSA